MDVIKGILGEAEFAEFDSDDFGDFSKVLNDMTAGDIHEYMQSPDATGAVVNHIQKHIGSAIRSLTLPQTITDMGIMQLLQNVNPGTILAYYRNDPSCYEKLKFLEDNYSDLKPLTKVPTASDFHAFEDMIKRVLIRMNTKGIQPTYPNVAKRVHSNSFMFYSPHATVKGGIVGSLHARRNMWHMYYRGIDYDRYCAENGISAINRRLF